MFILEIVKHTGAKKHKLRKNSDRYALLYERGEEGSETSTRGPEVY